MTGCVAGDQHTVRQRALILLSVADSVIREGWDDAVAVQLRRAAHDLLRIATGETQAIETGETAELSSPQ
jgi:hypothetical protein